MEHSRAVQTATWLVVADTARAMILAMDMMIAIAPKLKIRIRPHNWRRETWRFLNRKKGRMKTIC
jgi:tRNA nucleotidyltransferase (CCA-adding enzyme)